MLLKHTLKHLVSRSVILKACQIKPHNEWVLGDLKYRQLSRAVTLKEPTNKPIQSQNSQRKIKQ